MATKIENLWSFALIFSALIFSSNGWSGDLIRIGVLTPVKHSRVITEDIRSCFFDAVDVERLANVQFAFESTGGTVLGSKKGIQRLISRSVDFVVLMVETPEAIEAGKELSRRKIPYLSLVNEYKAIDKNYGLSIFNSEAMVSDQIARAYLSLPSPSEQALIVYSHHNKTLVTRLKKALIELGINAELHRFNIHQPESLAPNISTNTSVFIFTRPSVQARVIRALGNNHKGRVLMYPSDNDLDDQDLNQPLYEISYVSSLQNANGRLMALSKTYCKRMAIDERFVYRLDAINSAIHIAGSLAKKSIPLDAIKGTTLSYQSLIDSNPLTFNSRGFAHRSVTIRNVSTPLNSEVQL